MFPARKGTSAATMPVPARSGEIGPAACSLSMLVAILVVMLIGRPAEWVAALSTVPVTRIVFLIVLVYAFRVAATLSPVRLMSLPGLKMAMFYMALAVFSIAFSIYKSNTLQNIPGPVILLVSMILLVKAAPTVKDAERIMLAMVISAIALTIGTLQAYQGGRAEIGTENASYDPNDLAYVLITMLPIAAALFTVSTGMKKLALLGGIGAMLFTLVLTGSRGGYIAIFLVGIIFTFRPIALARDGRLKEVGAGSATGRVMGLVMALILAWVVAPPEIKDRLRTFVEIGSDYNMDLSDNSSRLLVWKRHTMATVQRPIGYGLASANTVDGMFGGLYKTTHNTLVQTLVELGFLGLFLLLRAYYVSWRDLRQAESLSKTSKAPLTPEQSRISLYSRALRMSLVGNITAGFFLSQSYGPTLWVTIAMCAVLVYLQRSATGSVEPQESRGGSARRPRTQ
jgi:O-antigen ligase